MNKKSYVLTIFLLVSTLMLVSCDSERERISNSKIRASQVDTVVRFFPDKHEIIKDDTILDKEGGIRVIVERETLMNQFATLIYEDDSTIVQDNYRDYSSTIKIYRHDSLLCEQTFIKADFPTL